jgi:hypothetical protein
MLFIYSPHPQEGTKKQNMLFFNNGVYSEPLTSIDAISPLFDNDFDGLILVLCAQLWQKVMRNEKASLFLLS